MADRTALISCVARCRIRSGDLSAINQLPTPTASAPAAMIELSIPFEFKDLPLP